MKEVHYFYAPDAELVNELPEEEARHAAKVLRLHNGDCMVLLDGKGSFHKARVTEITSRSCCYEILETTAQRKTWQGHIHLAVAPTKNMERMEWLAEKATEIGIDELSFVCCRFSERRTLNTDRLVRILIAAAKQSRKPFLPKLNDITTFEKFIERSDLGVKYIAHCLSENTFYTPARSGISAKDTMTRQYFPSVVSGGDTTVLIGPEGDFSVSEVNAAVSNGFVPISLGDCRLRTETAALYAVMLMNLKNAIHNDGNTML